MRTTSQLTVIMERVLFVLATGTWILGVASVFTRGTSVGGRAALLGTAFGMSLMFVCVYRDRRELWIPRMLAWIAGLVILVSLWPLLNENRQNSDKIRDVIQKCSETRSDPDCDLAREMCHASKLLGLATPSDCNDILKSTEATQH